MRESDSDIIKEIFADGMNLNEFKKVYNQEENYISENDKYKYIDYDFDRKLHYIFFLVLHMMHKCLS